MSLETLWLLLLGLLLAGYFVLGGYDQGVQMLHPFLGSRDGRDTGAGQGGRDEGTEGNDRDSVESRADGLGDRNAALDAIAPFFLGNEVWLVAFTGVLFGAFPYLEGTLLSGLYPLIVAILVGLVLGNAAVQLRGRARTARGRRCWDALIVFGGALPALCWGLVLGLLLHGVPRRADGYVRIGTDDVLTPFVLACGVTTALLFAAHGAAFVALRSEPELAPRARKMGTALLRAVGAAGSLSLLLTLFGAGASMTNRATSAVLAALFATALVVAWWCLVRGHRVRAFAATCSATLLPVPLLGAGQYPYVLVDTAGGGLTVQQAASDGATLTILTAFGVVVIPVILAYQLWSWWLFRGRTGRRHPRYF
ncbi:cytochrome d ubiquinol oxidase subunit 2 [Streptomyces sp. SID4919]|uniref:cytochrome d ubiquinol oxidase subunit II n=1 Tax=unclassified Streptomyces TaxID=2593676 RepID=UPI000823942E|nr:MULTISPECIES: cytochrome d ubiquinol oxidase subunit II [unclassified Streptomyces]MYY07658.1 cytochrome d ubiquinol oxidase subunit 2 [Streptomyces sp. SID4919]SCK52720.1 cytochrome d oxidase, subunit II (cydB) [Streptomyces sp. AmelKG-E11A]